MGNSVKTDNFLKAIRKHVKAQKKQMLTEVSQIKEEQLTITKKKAEQDMKREIADVSARLTGKLLEREIRTEDHRALIDSFLQEIGAEHDADE